MNRRSFFTALASAAALAIPGLALSSCAPKRFPWPGVTQIYRGYALWQAGGNRDALFVVHYRGDHWGLQPVTDPTDDERAALENYVDGYLLGARRRRRRFEVDERPDWRDPGMKCFEEVLFSDGVWRHCYIPPEMKQQFAQARMKEKLTDET